MLEAFDLGLVEASNPSADCKRQLARDMVVVALVDAPGKYYCTLVGLVRAAVVDIDSSALRMPIARPIGLVPVPEQPVRLFACSELLLAAVAAPLVLGICFVKF